MAMRIGTFSTPASIAKNQFNHKLDYYPITCVPPHSKRGISVSRSKAKDVSTTTSSDPVDLDLTSSSSSTSQFSKNSTTNSPFKEGKISSLIAREGKTPVSATTTSSQQQQEEQVRTSKTPFSSQTESPPSAASGQKAAFPVPSLSSPFESESNSSSANIDKRILASRRSILDALWKEKQDAQDDPSDILIDPSPTSPDDSKFQLIYGTNQVLLLFSFALIVGLMVVTALAAWKLGAFHYDEV